MELWKHPMNRLLCAEPLEGRWLLSIAAPSVNGVAREADVVEVVEDPEIDDEEEDDSEIDPSQLPAAVLAAMNNRFPGATIDEAELEEEDGDVEYGITATVGGKTVDVSFASNGTILEVEESVDASDVPQELRDWIEANFPGATIDEAALLTTAPKPTYELTFLTTGQQAMETTLALTPDTADVSNDAARTVAFSDAAVPAAPIEVEPAASRTAPSEASEAAAAVATAQDAEDDDDDAAAARRRDASEAFPAWVDAGQARVAEALASLAIGTGAAVWLPELADALSDAFPLNTAAVEQHLQQILAQIDAMTTEALADTTPAGAAMRLAIVVSLLAGVQLILLDRRLRKGGPVLVFRAASSSSWSWMLGPTIRVEARRRRRNVFRQ